MTDEPDRRDTGEAAVAPVPGDAAVVLLHGFGSGPEIWRTIERRLRAQGYRTVAPRLPGHGHIPPTLSEVHWSHWTSAVRTAFFEARATCATVFVVGHSLGATLGLYTAASACPPNGLVLMAPSLTVPVRGRLLLAGYALARRRTASWRRVGLSGPPPGIPADSPDARRIPLSTLRTNVQLKAAVAALLPAVQCPVAVIGGALDPLVSTAELARVAARLGGTDVRIHTLPRSGHGVPVAEDRDEACRLTLDFLASLTRQAPVAPARP